MTQPGQVPPHNQFPDPAAEGALPGDQLHDLTRQLHAGQAVEGMSRRGFLGLAFGLGVAAVSGCSRAGDRTRPVGDEPARAEVGRLKDIDQEATEAARVAADTMVNILRTHGDEVRGLGRTRMDGDRVVLANENSLDEEPGDRISVMLTSQDRDDVKGLVAAWSRYDSEGRLIDGVFFDLDVHPESPAWQVFNYTADGEIGPQGRQVIANHLQMALSADGDVSLYQMGYIPRSEEGGLKRVMTDEQDPRTYPPKRDPYDQVVWQPIYGEPAFRQNFNVLELDGEPVDDSNMEEVSGYIDQWRRKVDDMKRDYEELERQHRQREREEQNDPGGKNPQGDIYDNQPYGGK